MLAKTETTLSWGQMWQSYIASESDMNQTSAARRHRVDEAKLRYWLRGGSPTVDFLLAFRHSIPSKVKADLINALADGEFAVVPIDREQADAADPVMEAIALHGPVNDYVREVVNAYSDGVITPDEESRITSKYHGVRTSAHRVYITIIIHRVRRVARRVWRSA